MEELLDELIHREGDLPKITVAGIGGGGGNAVDHMYERGIAGVNFMVCNTDSQALEKSPVKRKILLGDGLGAGNDPKVGRNKTVESLDKVKESLDEFGTQMLFLTAGMGGGTGTGASPVIAKLAREMGILTVAIVTTPFSFEGSKRQRQANEGLEELKKYADSILIIKNDTIGEVYGNMGFYDGFRKADEVLTQSAKGIAELITVGGEHNIDFADVKNILTDSGRVHFSVVSAERTNQIGELVELALNSPLMEKSIAGAQSVIINLSAASFSGENAVTQNEFTEMSRTIAAAAGTNAAGNGPDIIWGTIEKPELGSLLELVLVATNFDEAVEKRAAVKVPDDDAPVMLGGKKNRYADISTMLKVPAYQRRNFTMVENVSRGSSEVMRDRDAEQPRENPVSSSLFDN